MDSRELREMAARAAGFEVNVAKGGGSWINDGSKIWPKWNPIDDDGDALRLALKIGISIEVIPAHDSVMAHVDNEHFSFSATEALDSFGARQAIIRVAAEIGRGMK